MSQTVLATFEDGVLKPDVPLGLAAQTRVRLVVEPLDTPTVLADEGDEDWISLEQVWAESEVDSGGPPPSRDALHDRD
jgi:hypothetical protein